MNEIRLNLVPQHPFWGALMNAVKQEQMAVTEASPVKTITAESNKEKLKIVITHVGDDQSLIEVNRLV